MRTSTSANDRLTVPSKVIASPVVVSPSNVLSPSAGLPERCGTRFFICDGPFPCVPFDRQRTVRSRDRVWPSTDEAPAHPIHEQRDLDNAADDKDAGPQAPPGAEELGADHETGEDDDRVARRA